jgi:hypothetical protein
MVAAGEAAAAAPDADGIKEIPHNTAGRLAAPFSPVI